MNEEYDELSKHERRQFENLSRWKTPPKFLEDKIVSRLKEANMISSPKPQRYWNILKLSTAFAALLLFFVGGALVGSRWFSASSAPVVKNDKPEFVLFLRPPSGKMQKISSDEELRRTKEYTAWAGEIGQKGFLVGGEKLKDSVNVLTKIDGQLKTAENANNPANGAVEGYFIIKADNYEQAVSITEGCPHLKYGGYVEVREIDRF